jgi:hypothetical protein
MGRALVGLAMLFGVIVIATGSDPFALAVLAAMSVSMLAVSSHLNWTSRCPAVLRAASPGLGGPLWVQDLRPVDHDCPVKLSVIRR